MALPPTDLDDSIGATTLTCPSCGARCSAFNVRCARCGEELPAEPSLSGTAELSPSGGGAIDPLAATVAAAPDEAPVDPSRGDPASTPAPAAPPGSKLGRFQVLDRLGSGAMGVVVRALDPTLGREVAIKILRTGGGGGQAQARLVREAQAMAKLRHPNVVTVHEVAVSGDHVLVVMERVEGRTLRAFCAEKGRSADEIRLAFLEAGRGLAAVHRAGLVHRDFKPDNVLVGADGRVQVTDFGLVGSTEGEGRPDAMPEGALSHGLTRSGWLLGTPTYMAPEQHEGRAVDARADQFAFCVSLWEALAGERPFDGETYAELRENVTLGKLREPPRGARLSARLRRVLARGLQVDRDARYPSMEALLVELTRDPAPTRRWAIAAGLVVLASVGGALAFRQPQKPTCDDAQARLEGVWDASRRSAVAAAFRKSGRAHAEASLAVVERALDDYAASWATMRVDACRATRVRHEQSPQLLDLRISCLEERREELRAYTELLGRADPALVDKAGTTARSLSSLGRCADGAGMMSTAPPPDDASLRARIERTRVGLARVNALRIAGKATEAHAEATPLVAEAKAIGYAPLHAEALVREEQIDMRPPDLAAAAAQLRDAIVVAERGHDEETQMIAWASLAFVQSTAGERDAAIESMRHGEALLDGLGRPLRLEAEVAGRLGSTASALDRPADAERLLLRSLRALEKLYPTDDPALAAPHVSLGNVYQELERHDVSLAEQRAALAIYQRAFGEGHPRTCITLLNLAGELEAVDQLAESLDTARLAVTACERALGHASVPTSYALMNESNALQRLGRLDEALPLLREALAVSTALGGDTSAVLANLAELQSRRGQADEAIELVASALALAAKRYGDDGSQVRRMLSGQAEIFLVARRAREAIAPAERYRALSIPLPDGDLRSRALLGRVLVAAGKLTEARALLEPAFDAEGAKAIHGKPLDLAAARLAFGRALVPVDAARGRDLEAEARAELTKLGPAGVELIADLDRQLPTGTRARK